MAEKLKDSRLKFELIFDEVEDKLSVQNNLVPGLESKSAIILATIGFLFSGYLRMLTYWEAYRSYKFITMLEMATLSVAIAFALYSLYLAKNQRWRLDPSPRKLIDLVKSNSSKSVEWVQQQITNSRLKAMDGNAKLIAQMYLRINISVAFIMISFALIFFHVALVVYEIDELSIIIPLK